MDVYSTPVTNARDVLGVIDAAIQDQQSWLSQWHRTILCGVQPTDNLISETGYLETPFGLWLDKNKNQGLLAQPRFVELGESYRELFVFSRFLLLRVGEGKTLPIEEYDEFSRKVSRYSDLLNMLQLAFRKAVSELDPLTGLHNRQVMLSELDGEYERAIRGGGDFCIALADIDHFKQVNDTYGHGVGDVVLEVVAGRFLSMLRPYDTIYRYGGEEFLIGLPNANPGTAISVIERLRKHLSASSIIVDGRDDETTSDGKEQSLGITASFGVSLIRAEYSLKEIIEQADAALYQAKAAGRNQTCLWAQNEADETSDN
jgi:diguanylate cyclase (GGDEF)-like protein